MSSERTAQFGGLNLVHASNERAISDHHGRNL